jgi:hypothetical protein
MTAARIIIQMTPALSVSPDKALAGYGYGMESARCFLSFAGLKPGNSLKVSPNHDRNQPATMAIRVAMPCHGRFYQHGSKHKTHQPSLKGWPTDSKGASNVAPGLFNQGRGRSLRYRSDFGAPFIVRFINSSFTASTPQVND